MGVGQFVLEKGTLFAVTTGGEINNRLSEFVLYFSKNNPVAYGFLSIIIVVLAGISFSYARELIHHIRYDIDKKKYKFFG